MSVTVILLLVIVSGGSCDHRPVAAGGGRDTQIELLARKVQQLEEEREQVARKVQHLEEVAGKVQHLEEERQQVAQKVEHLEEVAQKVQDLEEEKEQVARKVHHLEELAGKVQHLEEVAGKVQDLEDEREQVARKVEHLEEKVATQERQIDEYKDVMLQRADFGMPKNYVENCQSGSIERQFFGVEAQPVTFPIGFRTRPTVLVSVNMHVHDVYVNVEPTDITSSGFNLLVVRGSTSATYRFHYMACA